VWGGLFLFIQLKTNNYYDANLQPSDVLFIVKLERTIDKATMPRPISTMPNMNVNKFKKSKE